MLSLLFWPAIACILLTGIHAYLGIHILDRGIIFIDLALAQLAALGYVIALILAAHQIMLPPYLVALVFTIIGSILFTVINAFKIKIPQEAFIGIVYVIAAAAVIAVVSKSPLEGDLIKDSISGNILFVTPQHLLQVGLLYAAVGLFHYYFRKQFIGVSVHFQQKQISPWWDFLFYITFGMVVSSSVSIAGVLLVFSYLIITAVAAYLFTSTIRSRLIMGWIVGIVASFSGLWLSVVADLPTGPSIIICFGILLSILIFASSIKKSYNNRIIN